MNDGNSTLYSGFDSMLSSMMTGTDTFTSHSTMKNKENGMSEDEFDVESVGVSAILDAEDDDDHVISRKKGRDRYASSFLDTSSDADDRSSTSDGDSASSGSFFTEDSQSTSSESNESWDDAAECGTLVNVKPKLGERVSRVTPDHTSHLLRSRFRRKYTPRGSYLDS